MGHFLKKAAAIVVIAGVAYFAYSKWGGAPSENGFDFSRVEGIKNTIVEKIEEFKNSEKPNYSMDNVDGFSEKYPVLEGDLGYTGLDFPEGFTSQAIQKLELNAGGCTVKLVPSTDGEFHIEAKGCKKLQHYIEKATLYLNIAGAITGGEKVTDGVKGTVVTLYCPANTLQISVDIELGMGSVEVESITSQNVVLKCGAGNISAGKIDADELHIDLDAGQVKIGQAETDEMEADVGMGSMEIETLDFSDGKVACSVGTVSLTLKGGEEDYNYSLNTAAGSIRLGEREYKGMSGEQKIDNKASKNLKVECSMGSVKIQ